MSRHDARNLTTQEIDLLIHLMAVGAGGHKPVLLLAGARERATKLWRLCLVDIWLRQSLSGRGSEGPFYSLTPNGRERATALYLSRQSRASITPHPNHPSVRTTESPTPPPPQPEGERQCKFATMTRAKVKHSRATCQLFPCPPGSRSAPSMKSSRSMAA